VEREQRRGLEKALEKKVSNVTNIFAKNKARQNSGVRNREIDEI